MGSRLPLFTAAAAVFAVDRLTKWVIETKVAEWQTIGVIPGFFQIVYSKNSGVAFGLFNDRNPSSWQTMLLGGVLAAILLAIGVALWKSTSPSSAEHWTLRWGLALVLGGACGNLFDRVAYGSVTDFLDVFVGSRHWPVFNVADSGITVGAGLILLSLWQQRTPATDRGRTGSAE